MLQSIMLLPRLSCIFPSQNFPWVVLCSKLITRTRIDVVKVSRANDCAFAKIAVIARNKKNISEVRLIPVTTIGFEVRCRTSFPHVPTARLAKTISYYNRFYV